MPIPLFPKLMQVLSSMRCDAFEPFIGEVRWVGFNFAPRGWAHCNGQLLPIAQNTALFSILGTTYGGNGRTDFALPDMRSSAMIHAGSGPGLSTRRLGAKGGVENVNLSSLSLPSHSHQLRADISGGDDVKPNDRSISRAGRLRLFSNSPGPFSSMGSDAITATGGGQPHNNMQPFVTAYCIIALQGVFPSR